MKKIIYILFVFVLIGINSCKKDEPVKYSTTKSMTAKLEGNLWRAVTPKGSLYYDLYQISGESKIGHRISLFLNTVAVGTYPLSPTSSAKAEYIMPDDGGLYTTHNGTGTSGYVEITEVDANLHTVTGKFYFVANKAGTHKLKTISDGKFTNMEYIYIAPNTGNNKLTAVVSGSNYASTATGNVNFNTLMINSSDGNKIFYIMVPKDIAVGSYDINETTTCSINYLEGTESFTIDDGTIVITSNNSTNQIKGAFTFSAHNNNDATQTVAVTDGYFEVVY